MRISVRTMVICGLLVAAGVVLKTLSPSVAMLGMPVARLPLAYIAIYLAAVAAGPYAALLTGALVDFLGASLFPIGPYFPGYTLTAALAGLIAGFIYHKLKAPFWVRTVLMVVAVQVICSVLLNTLWIYMGQYQALSRDAYIISALLIALSIGMSVYSMLPYKIPVRFFSAVGAGGFSAIFLLGLLFGAKFADKPSPALYMTLISTRAAWQLVYIPAFILLIGVLATVYERAFPVRMQRV